MQLLRDEETFVDWVDRLATCPFVGGTMIRAPVGDRRHGWAAKDVEADATAANSQNRRYGDRS